MGLIGIFILSEFAFFLLKKHFLGNIGFVREGSRGGGGPGEEGDKHLGGGWRPCRGLAGAGQEEETAILVSEL